MKKLIQKLLFQLIPPFSFIIIIEYLLKFGFKEFSFNKLMEILPGMALDFGIIALFFVVYDLIKFRKKNKTFKLLVEKTGALAMLLQVTLKRDSF